VSTSAALTVSRLSKRFGERLVYCSINGFGSSEHANPPAHDLNFMALAGLLVPDPESGRCQSRRPSSPISLPARSAP
jgi:crotonobetainyl-CoA:carnitine CoA-transferase CaiB-like acyl-CoA transferase